MFPLVSGTFGVCLTCSASGPPRRVLTGYRSSPDSLPEPLLSLSLLLEDALDPPRIPPRSRVARGELGRARACSILSALEERSRLKGRQTRDFTDTGSTLPTHVWANSLVQKPITYVLLSSSRCRSSF